MKLMTRAAKEPTLPPAPDIPFAPLERRQGEEYARASQFVADLQGEVSYLKTENAALTSELTVTQGTIDRLRREIDELRASSQDRERGLIKDCQDLQQLYVAVMTKLEIVGAIIVEVINSRKPLSHEASLAAVEEALLGDVRRGESDGQVRDR